MPINAYTVLSEFKFDVGQAVLGSEQLQGKVEDLSNSVNHAMQSVKGLGMGFIAQFSGAQTGILGLLGGAISASDKFTNSQLSFAQIIDSNMGHLTGTIGTLNERMAVSKKIMNDIGQDARKFGIPAAELLEMTKGLSAMLVPKGLAGENFKGARDLSRNLLKSAPNLGIHPADVQGQLLRSVEGSASMGDTLFRRLLTEAPEPFQAAKVKDAKGFNMLDATKRFNVLNEAMAKFANNSDLLAMRANTLSGVMQRVKDLFSGFTSILKPLGDVILPPLIEIMNMAIQWLDVHGRKIIESMARFLKPLIENPKAFILDLKQVASLSEDLKMATSAAGILLSLMHLKELMGFLSKMPVIGPGIQALGAMIGNMGIFSKIMQGITWVFGNMGTVAAFLWPILKMVASGLLHFGAGIAAFLIPLQGLSRALARMEIESLEWFAQNAASLTDSFASLSHSISVFFAPIQDMIKGFEELFFTVLGGTYFLDWFKAGLEGLASLLKDGALAFAEIYAAFRGLIMGVVDIIFTAVQNIRMIIDNLLSGNFTGLLDGTDNIFESAMAAGAEEFTKTLDRLAAPTMTDGNVDNAKVSNNVHNYDVKMSNSFKEVLQPDRIAFTIKDQLEKSSNYRTQGKSTSVAGLQAKAI